MGLLGGRRAMVTGAGGGIGGAIARACAREGARLLLSDRDQAKLGPVAEERAAFGAETHIHRAGFGSDRQLVAQPVGVPWREADLTPCQTSCGAPGSLC